MYTFLIEFKGVLQEFRFRVLEAYFEVHRLGHYKSTFFVLEVKIGSKNRVSKIVKMVVFVPQFAEPTLKGLEESFGHFAPFRMSFRTKSKSAICWV